MKKWWPLIIVPVFLIWFSGVAMAADIGDPIQINQYCMTVSDFEAYMLRNQPDPIPNDIDCYNTSHIMFMGTVLESVKDFVDNGKSFSLFRIGELAVVTGAGFLQLLSGTVFVPMLNEGKDA